MENKELINSLRKLANSSTSKSVGRTSLEKLATIALIHDQMPKYASLFSGVKEGSGLVAKAKKALIGVGVLGATAGAGIYGHTKGKKKGRRAGRKEMYRSAYPYVRRAKMRADRAAAVARYLRRKGQKSGLKKQSSRGRNIALGLAAGALPLTSYAVGKHYGGKKGRKKGRTEVARSALRRIGLERTRFRKALDYMRSKKMSDSGGGRK